MNAFQRMAPLQHDTLEGVPEPAEQPHLVGHESAAASLAQAYRAGRMHHGLLLAGPAGIGKATLAFRLAHHLLSHPDPASAPAALEDPDPAGPTFRKIAQGAHPAVLHLARPANERTKGFKTVITVEEVRKVGRFLGMTAHDGGWRVVVVDPADDLNTSAANALLKSLEEPPPRTVFVLISHAPGRLLPTIRSRCQLVRLESLRPGELADAMSAIGLALPPDPAARAALADRARGSVRAAIMLTEYGGLEIAGAVDSVLAADAFDAVAAAKIADAVTGRDGALQFDMFNDHLLDALSGAAAAQAAGGEGVRADRLAEGWTAQRVARLETETYNLDKRQFVTASLMRAHTAMRGN